MNAPESSRENRLSVHRFDGFFTVRVRSFIAFADGETKLILNMLGCFKGIKSLYKDAQLFFIKLNVAYKTLNGSWERVDLCFNATTELLYSGRLL